ncbi:MAG: D-alanyl-D-alanine carboxypeptidase/D-alanyl-D-alanine-endopeptidase [Saprospiraceae bacterium]
MKYKLIILSILMVAIATDSVFAQRHKKKRGRSAAKTEVRPLDLHLEQSAVFNKSFTGFALYDPVKNQMLYEYNAGKYFTPASNTKLFTFYTSLRILGDSIPALQYSRQGDLLVFWGTGDPSFLHPGLVQSPGLFDFLKNSDAELLFCPANFKDKRYGAGWMWSDYPYYYQAEKSPFPVYGNAAHFQRDSSSRGIEVVPSFLKKNLHPGPVFDPEDIVGRMEFDNSYTYDSSSVKGDEFELHVPFRYSPAFLAEVLSDTLGRAVHVLTADMLPPSNAHTLYSLPADSLYWLMLQQSDNFIAEQLLLLCSWEKFGVMNTEQIIDYSTKYLLNDLPDEPQWVDGSGLSRYNLFTPRDIVRLLEKIYQIVPRERLFSLFPAGGVSGTIEEDYTNGTQPYVFAKTGTLRNNHCLSGYLLTKSGKVFIFSFMHNNFTNGTTPIKREMEKVLKKVRDRF